LREEVNKELLMLTHPYLWNLYVKNSLINHKTLIQQCDIYSGFTLLLSVNIYLITSMQKNNLNEIFAYIQVTS